ncbi:MAG: hypothetical protein U0165_07160 [Polyangiaceae bacterium]
MSSQLSLPLLCLSALALVQGCRSDVLPEPKFGPHPEEELAKAKPIDALPTEPVKVSEIKEKAPVGKVWIDGEYVYDAGRWQWVAGAWCTPPSGSYYFAKAAGRRERHPVGDPIVRWNAVESRFEEVRLGKDVWKWLPGTWYRVDKGKATPAFQKPNPANPRCPDLSATTETQ